jgi:hypothetical protein
MAQVLEHQIVQKALSVTLYVQFPVLKTSIKIILEFLKSHESNQENYSKDANEI